MIGYIKCKKDAGKEMKSMATSFLGRQIIGQVSAFRKSSERKPIKIQQYVYNDKVRSKFTHFETNFALSYCSVEYWSKLFKNMLWGIFFNLQLLKLLFQSINCWLLTRIYLLGLL